MRPAPAQIRLNPAVVSAFVEADAVVDAVVDDVDTVEAVERMDQRKTRTHVDVVIADLG